MYIIIGLLLPFLGTILGASLVFLLKKEVKPRISKALLGFAAGVMLAASIWSLLIPSIELAGAQGNIAWLPAVIGFLAGMTFLLLLDTVIPHLHHNAQEYEGKGKELKKKTMLIFAITLHNIPEGLAVGVALAGVMSGNNHMTISSALVLSMGIALQNFPEGAIVSMPLKEEGKSKTKAFMWGTISGVVEPIAALLAIFLMKLFVPILPYLLAFAAGAMIYVIVEELIPETQVGKHSNIGTIGLAIGFILMMVLDIVFG